MGEPRDIDRAPLSPAAARRVLVALDADDDAGSGGGRGFPAIAGYTIERELGRGAGGVTYLAHKAGSEAKIALKVLHARAGNGASQRAWRELDTLQQARAPSVPRLLDFGTTDHSMYIATEYIEGTPLSELYETERPADLGEMRERVRLLEKIARAAHSLHERGVIHRDLKHSNVIVVPAGPESPGDSAGAAKGEVGEPFIIDLGIALIDSPDLHQTLTQDGQPVGTPAFMAPEQARGRREEISTRSDIYSLGAIGYWLCTGETPHDLAGATLHEAIRRVGSEAGRDPRSIARHLPKPLAGVLAKACSGKVSGRYTSAAEFADDLQRWRNGRSVLATDRGAWHRLAGWIDDHPTLSTAYASSLMLAGSILLSIASTWWIRQQPHHLTITTSASGTAVRVESIAGREVFRWDGPPKAFPAAFDSRHPTTRWFEYAVLARGYGDETPLRGSLCWYQAGAYETPALSHAPTVPAAYGNPEPTIVEFAAQSDIYPHRPGEEIVAIHRAQRGSMTAIIVYSWDGVELSRIWHDGHLRMVRYLPRHGLLVCVGVNSEFGWAGYGFEEQPEYIHPSVVFAFTPRQDHQGALLSLTAEGEPPAWAYAVLPPSSGEWFEWDSQALAGGIPVGEEEFVVRVDLAGRLEQSRHVSWLIGVDGAVEPIGPDDAYLHSPTLPPRESITLDSFEVLRARVSD